MCVVIGLLACGDKRLPVVNGVFQDHDRGFSISVPMSWDAVESRSTRTAVLQGPVVDGFSPSINFREEKFSGTAEEYVKSAIAFVSRQSAALQILGQAPFKTDGGDSGMVVTMANNMTDRSLRQRSYDISRPGRIVIATCTCSSAAADGFDQLCDECIRSIRFTEH